MAHHNSYVVTGPTTKGRLISISVIQVELRPACWLEAIQCGWIITGDSPPLSFEQGQHRRSESHRLLVGTP